jgi:hypothetical protein
MPRYGQLDTDLWTCSSYLGDIRRPAEPFSLILDKLALTS